MNDIFLEARGVRKSYGSLDVLRGIDLSIKQGEFVAIVGPSGAGKSTLLHILGILDRPTAGDVLLEKIDVYHQNDVKRAELRNRHIGFIFQFYHLLAEFSALENVMLPALVGGVKQQDAAKKAKALLGRIGLSARETHRPNELSGGEQQRVAIARALMNDPKVLLCDEPTGNLDSKTGQGIIELLCELNRNNKQTIVIVTHDEEMAKRSDRVIQMRDGLIQ